MTYLYSVLALVLAGARGYAGPDTHHMWVLGPRGVHIYSADGATLVTSIANTGFCQTATSQGTTTQNCAFKDAKFDGEQYVWATNTQNGSFVEMFNAKTGAHSKVHTTCGFPWTLDVAPHRDEVWVHCWSPDAVDGDTGHLDTFSTTDMALDHKQVALVPELSNHGHGQVFVDPTIPNYAYGTLLNENTIFKVDAETKEVVKRLPVDLVKGLYRVSYSKRNGHLYMRAYVCCSCGIDKDTRAACSTRGGGPSNVSITTGPSAGTVEPGSCGHGCEGSLADTIGVIEYDLIGERQVANFNDALGLGGNPYTSPLGDYTVILSNDGSKVRVIRAQCNGQSSTDMGTILTGFAHGGTAAAVSDVSFVEDATHNIAIFAATTDNFLVLVDMAKFLARPQVSGHTKRLDLQESNDVTSSGHGRGARRSVTWVHGTNYVWVNSNVVGEIHVIELGADGDIQTAKILREITDSPSALLVYVGPAAYPGNPAGPVTSCGPPVGLDEVCFPSASVVTKADGTKARLDELVEGDSIVAASADGGLTSGVLSSLSIAKPEADAAFLTISASGAKLKITPEHHVPVGDTCCSNLKKAKDVAVGDVVWTARQGAPTAHEVTHKGLVVEKGLHSPVLTNGAFPIVDGVVTSFDRIESVTLAALGLEYVEPLLSLLLGAKGAAERLVGAAASTLKAAPLLASCTAVAK